MFSDISTDLYRGVVFLILYLFILTAC